MKLATVKDTAARRFLITIRQHNGAEWVTTHLPAIAACSADALLGVIDRLPFGARVKVVAL